MRCSTSTSGVPRPVATSMGWQGRGAAADATGEPAEQLAGMDALVNSASYRINLDAMRACLEAGCHYLDLGGLYTSPAEQLELSSEFEAARPLWRCSVSDRPRARRT